MQTYKNYKQCTTISDDKIKYLSAGYAYFSKTFKIFAYPESKIEQPINISLIFEFQIFNSNKI